MGDIYDRFVSFGGAIALSGGLGLVGVSSETRTVSAVAITA